MTEKTTIKKDEDGTPYFEKEFTIRLRFTTYNKLYLNEANAKEIVHYLNNTHGWDEIGYFEEVNE